MTPINQSMEASPAITNPPEKSRLGHWMRVVVMFLSGGFIFPHAMTENDEIAKQAVHKNAEVKK